MKKAAIAILLTASMMIGMTGCELGNKFSGKKMIKYFEEELDADEEDPDDIIDSMKEADRKAFKGGLWSSLDKKQTKKAFDDLDLDDFFGPVKKAESSVVYVKTTEGSGKDQTAVCIMVLTFTDKKDIDDLFDGTDEIIDELCDTSYEHETDDNDNEMIAWLERNNDQNFYVGLYRDGKNAVMLISVNDDDAADDFCDEFELTSPVSLKD